MYKLSVMFRRYFLLLAVFAVSISGCAQVRIDSVEKLQLPGAGQYFHPRLDDQGTRLLLTAENYKGLSLYDLENKVLTSISEADGAGYTPLISGDGSSILFTVQEFIQNRLHIKILAHHAGDTVNEVLAPPMREFSSLYHTRDQIVFRSEGQIKSARIGSVSPVSAGETGVGIENQKLMFYTGGTSRELAPYDNESYIWPTVSPAGKKIAAYAMGKGAFICDSEGKLLRELGRVEAPVWISDDFIAGMVTKDDGHHITSSSVVVVKVRTGDRQTVSPAELTAMYPSVARQGGKMVFQTDKGEIYMISYHITP